LSDPVGVSRSLLLAARGGELSEAKRIADGLDAVDPFSLAGDPARIAFWVNLYNALLLRELAWRPRRGSLLRQRRMFRSALCRVGGHEYSLDAIEHGVLRKNARPPLRLGRMLGRGDPRLAAMPARLDPRIHFALNCGAVSCPPIVPYDAGSIDAELDRVTAAYVRAETTIDPDRGRVTLPYLIRLYRADFGGRSARLRFAVRYLREDDAAWLRSRGRVRIGYAGFDWTIAGDR
jgi:Protein of unknown function, DUF547